MPTYASSLALATFLFVSGLAANARAEVEDLRDPPPLPEPGIPEVTSQEALDALEPLTLFDGWELRLAIAPHAFSEKPAKPGARPDFSQSPWRVLYADFRRTKKGAEFPRTGQLMGGEFLGPLEYDLDFDRDALFDRAPLEVIRLERRHLLHERSDHHLFAAAISCATKGGYRLRIYPTLPERKPGAKKRGDLIAESIWKQDAPIPMHWVEFAKTQYIDLPDLGIPVPNEMVVPFVPSTPEFEAHQSLLSPRIEKERKAEGPTAILGMIPAKPDPGFKISLAGAGIAITLEEPVITEIDRFLARWWIDGKPVQWTFDEIPAGGVEEELERMRRALEQVLEFKTRIPFRKPAALKGAKPDSKVSLQLLYSPTGTNELEDFRAERMEKLRQTRDVLKQTTSGSAIASSSSSAT